LERSYPAWPWSSVEKEIRDMEFDAKLLAQINAFAMRMNINIGFCDIASAIQIVREGNTADFECDDLLHHTSDEEQNEQDRILEEIQFFGWNNGGQKGIFEWQGHNHTQSNDRTFLNLEYDYTSNKIYFDECHFLRIYGSQTTSQSKLDYIFSSLGITKELPHFIKCLCAGDGYGGFIEYLSTLTTSSIFTFNTLLTTAGKNCFPYSAINSLINHNNTADINLLDQGLDDLSSLACRDALINKGDIYSVVTCDADVHWSDHTQSERILLHMIQIYLMCSVQRSLFICKFNLGMSRYLLTACSLLRYYCTYVYIVRCPQSNLGGEIYIVASNRVRTPLTVESITLLGTDEEARHFDRYLISMKDQYEHDINNTNYNVRPVIRKAYRELRNDLECSATSKLYSRVAMIYDVKSEMLKFSYRDEFYSSLIEKIVKNNDILKRFVDKPSQYNLRSSSYHQDTLTHRQISSMKYITSEGCIFMFHMNFNKPGMTKRDIRIRFNEIMERLPREFGFFPVSSKMYLNDYMIHNNKKLNPYQKFMDGIRLSQMIIGYVEHSRLRIRKGVPSPLTIV